MKAPLPIVRHMLICDDARPTRGNPRKMTVHGLLNTIEVQSRRFPARFGFCVYLLLTECRGSGIGRIRVVDAESGELGYEGGGLNLRFGKDPLLAHAVVVRITECELPAPGLYWIEFRYEDELLAREPLLVR